MFRFGVEKDRMDKAAVGHEYEGKTDKHASQKDYAAGFGGKYGVQKDRIDKVWKCVKSLKFQDYYRSPFQSAVGWDHVEKVEKHESQKDYKSGFGGEFGVQSDRVDRSAVGWDHVEALQKHESQKGKFSGSRKRHYHLYFFLPDYAAGFGGKYGVQSDRVDKSALGWEHVEKVEKHESQKG